MGVMGIVPMTHFFCAKITRMATFVFSSSSAFSNASTGARITLS